MDIEEITSGTMNSPSDLIDLEESLFATSKDEEGPPAAWAFRGQPRGYKTLVPSFQRIFTGKKSVRTSQIIEQDLIAAFRLHYKDLRGRTSDMPVPQQVDQNFDLRCLSVMQHYGVPTRLLDWTADFWTAVYFACAGDPGQDAELWFYNRGIFLSQRTLHGEFQDIANHVPIYPVLPPPEPKLLLERNNHVIFELDPQITPRMREQTAHHTVSTDIFADHAQGVAELAAQFTWPNCFRRVVIASGCKERTLQFLQKEKGLTASTIFPDVEGLGKFLRWHLESLVTSLL